MRRWHIRIMKVIRSLGYGSDEGHVQKFVTAITPEQVEGFWPNLIQTFYTVVRWRSFWRSLVRVKVATMSNIVKYLSVIAAGGGIHIDALSWKYCRGRWICRTWKWRTKKEQRLENAEPGKWRTPVQQFCACLRKNVIEQVVTVRT